MKKVVVLFGIASVLLTGCCGIGTNHFANSYSSPIGEGVVPPPVKPEIIVAVNQSDYNDVVADIKLEGGAVLGTSTFNRSGYTVCKDHLKSLAKKQGADYVVAMREFTNEERRVETYQEYVPIYGANFQIVGGFYRPAQRTVVYRYFDYSATLLRAASEEPVVP